MVHQRLISLALNSFLLQQAGVVLSSNFEDKSYLTSWPDGLKIEIQPQNQITKASNLKATTLQCLTDIHNEL